MSCRSNFPIKNLPYVLFSPSTTTGDFLPYSFYFQNALASLKGVWNIQERLLLDDLACEKLKSMSVLPEAKIYQRFAGWLTFSTVNASQIPGRVVPIDSALTSLMSQVALDNNILLDRPHRKDLRRWEAWPQLRL